MSEILLKVENLSCGYPDRTVLSDVNLTVRRGEIVALLGPNGSGKSTLLKTISKTLRPLEGRIKLGGVDAGSMRAVEIARRVAFVPQEEIPAFDFSSLQIVLMGRIAHSRGLFETAQDHLRASEAMKTTDTSQFADRHVTKLSGGERQRVLIARALAQEAPLLLLDEPTAHLDAGHQVATSRLLQALAASGYGVLAAAHDLNWASSLATRSVVLGEGRVLRDGPTSEVLASGVLEAVYGVKFLRFHDDSGVLRMFPN